MKKTLIIISVIALILLAGFLSLDYFISRIVDTKVKEIQKELSGTFNFEYSNLKVSFFSKRIVLKEFRLESVVDTSYKQNSVEFELEKLIIIIESYEDVLFDGKLHIKKLILRHPIINYGLKDNIPLAEVNEDSFNEEEFEEETRQKRPETNRLLKFIIIDKLSVIKGEANIFSKDKINNKLLFIKSLGLESTDITIDLNETSLDRMFQDDEFKIQIKDLSSDEIKNLHLDIKKIDFDKKSKSVEISGVHLKNTEKVKSFIAKQKFRSVWMDISVDKIYLNVSPRQIFNKGIIYLKKIEIEGAHAELYNDVTLALKPDHSPMPPSIIRNIPLPFKIDSIILRNSELKYLHKDKADNPGLLQFSEIGAIVTRATNIDYLIEQNSRMNIDIKAKPWGKGSFNGNISIDLDHPMDYVYAKGTITNLPLKEAENMIKPLYGVEITSGEINVLKYDLTMNEDIGVGSLQFDYADLKVDIKKHNEKKVNESGEQKSNKLFNFAANGAVITTNMPGSKNYESEGYIIFDRTKNKPIFDLLWNCLQVGIMDIVIPNALYNSKTHYQKKEKKAVKLEQKVEKEERKRKKEK